MPGRTYPVTTFFLEDALQVTRHNVRLNTDWTRKTQFDAGANKYGKYRRDRMAAANAVAVATMSASTTTQIFLFLVAFSYLSAFGSLYWQWSGLYGDDGVTPAALKTMEGSDFVRPSKGPGPPAQRWLREVASEATLRLQPQRQRVDHCDVLRPLRSARQPQPSWRVRWRRVRRRRWGLSLIHI